MSIVVETFLSCDGENASRHCIGQFGVDNRHLTGAQHRNDAKLEGWKTPEDVDELEKRHADVINANPDLRRLFVIYKLRLKNK